MKLFRRFLPEDSVKGHPNGRMWKKFDQQEKILYLMGVEHGVGLASEEVGDSERFNNLRGNGSRFSEVVAEIDRFYNDTADIPVPVALAYVWVVRKMSGFSPEDLFAFLDRERQFWRGK